MDSTPRTVRNGGYRLRLNPPYEIYLWGCSKKMYAVE